MQQFTPKELELSAGKVPSRVLVVEDERHIARLLDYVLRKQGYEVSVTLNAEEAISEIETFAPDALLLDIGLPGMSGMDFLRRIRKNPRWEKLAVIVLSGHWFKHDDPSLVEAGATAQCSKPIAPSKLIRTLQQCGIQPRAPGISEGL